MTLQTDAAVLAARAALLARPLARTEQGTTTALLAFELAGGSYALALAYVFAVVELGDVAAVPGAVPTLLGVTNHRGVLLPVADLGRILGQPRGNPLDALHALVLGDGRAEVAIPVTKLPVLLSVDLSRLQAMPVQASAATDSRLYCGLTAAGVTVLDAAWLLAGPSCRARPGQGDRP